MRIREFEWDEDNVLHLELGHGVSEEEAEEVFVVRPLFRKTKRGHYVVLGPTREGRFLTIVFENRGQGMARVITGWDMTRSEAAYWRKERGR